MVSLPREILPAHCLHRNLDTGLGGGVLVLPTFATEFGLVGQATHVAQLQGNVVAILQGGAFFGALGGAPLEDHLGRKWVSCQDDLSTVITQC